MRNFAKRLIAYEALKQRSSPTKTPAAFHVIDKLRPQLTMLMGIGGFRALLLHALALAKAEASALRALHVAADATLDGWEALLAQLGPAEFLKARTVLLVQLLGLLVVLIGPGLTSRLLGEIWPQISLDDAPLGNRGKNAKTK